MKNDLNTDESRLRSVRSYLRKPARRSEIAPFMALDALREASRLAQAGASIMRLEVGEPGAPPPRRVREAAIAALQGGRVGYTDALGLPSLREEIAAYYRRAHGLSIAPDRVAVTTGSSGGFVLAFLAMFDPGARVAIAAPGYPAYRNVLEALGCVCVSLETPADGRAVVTPDMIAESHRQAPLDGVLLMSPANPTGAMMTPEELRGICDICQRLDIAFVSDEIYHGLTYDAPAETALRYWDEAIIVNSFSKYYCMTGWRVGWLILPPALVRPVERLAQSLAISTPYLSQIAAQAAFDAEDELEAIKAGYARNRAALLEGLPGAGFSDFVAPDGAFYFYVDISRHSDDCLEFCRRMTHEAGVAATPGLDFDRRRGARAMRLSYAGPEADILEAIARMRSWLKPGRTAR